MSSVDEAARVVRPGRATDGAQNAVYNRATADATSVTYEVPAGWKGQWVRFYAKTAEIQVAFGKSDVGALTKDQASTLATEALTAVDGTGFPVAAGTFQDFIVGDEDTHFEVVGTGTGSWFAVATGPAGG